MKWSEFEEARLLDRFWREGNVTCPTSGCGKTLNATLVPTFEGPFETLTLECPLCQKAVCFTQENDRFVDDYREWTVAERSAMEQKLTRNETIYCPVDGTLCDVHDIPLFPNTPNPMRGAYIGCMRCGQEINVRRL